MYRRWTAPEKDMARKLKADGANYPAIAAALSEQFGTARTAKKVADFFRKLDTPEAVSDTPPGVVAKTLQDGTRSVVSEEPLSMDEVFGVFGLKRSDWKVLKFVPNIYGGKWQAKLWLEPAQHEVVAGKWDELLDEYRARGRGRRVMPPQGDKLYEIAIFDNHIGLYSWGEETGQSQDLYIALDRHQDSFDYLLEQAPSGSHILYIVGQDLFHFDKMVDGKGGATAAGTQQDVDTRYQKLFRSTVEMVRRNIDRAIEYGHSVEIVVVPGNHDTTVTFYLGELLRALYGDNMVDNDPRSRKYYRWGDVLLGFAHGRDEKIKDLPRIMEVETRHDEGATRAPIREWHLGHTHHEEVNEEYGVRTRIMPALASTDSWHATKCYVGGIRGARGLLWDKTHGLDRIDCYNLPALTKDDTPARVRGS